MEITHELKALKTRLSRLQEVFNSLPINPPGPEEWPFWLEKFNALSGQFTSFERELLTSGNLFKEFLIEPVNVPLNPSIPTDSIPNILLRTKLPPEVTQSFLSTIKNKSGTELEIETIKDSQIKLYSTAVRALQEKFSEVLDELQRSAADQTSLLLAKEMRISASASGSATPRNNKTRGIVRESDEDLEVILENSVRWLYTGQ